MDPTLLLIGGAPGAGKTTLARFLFAAANLPKSHKLLLCNDDFPGYWKNGKRVYSKDVNWEAARWCYRHAERAMDKRTKLVILHNTFIQQDTRDRLITYAEDRGYTAHSIIVENHHGSESVHSVPADWLAKARTMLRHNIRF